MHVRPRWRSSCAQLVILASVGILTACSLVRAPQPEAPVAKTARKARPAPPQTSPIPIFHSPVLAVGGERDLYLMWASAMLNKDKKQNDIHVSRSVDDGLTWGPHRSLKADPTRNTGGRGLVADRNGTVTGFWGAGLRTDNIDVVAARSTDRGETWTGPDRLYAGELHVPELIVGPGGALFAVIPEGPEANWRLSFFRSTDGGKAWERLPTLTGMYGETSQFGIRSFRVIADDQGRLHVVWQERGKGVGERIFYSRLEPATAQGAWVPTAMQLSGGTDTSSSRAYEPAIGVDPAGHLFVAWVETWDTVPPMKEGRFPQAVYVTRSMDGGRTWLPQPIRLSDAGPEAFRHIATHVEVANDGRGQVYVAWREEVGFPPVERLVFRRSTDYGATWTSDSRSLFEVKPFPAIIKQFYLKSGGDGHVYLLWQVAGFAWDVLFMRSGDGGATWPSAPTRLATLPQADSGAHNIAFETSGSHLYVAWDIGPTLPSEIFLNRSTDFGKTWLAREVQVTKRAP